MTTAIDISKLEIRWAIRRDMPEILTIENESFEFPWSEDEFIRCLRQRNCICMVADLDGTVVGFMIYELHKSRLHLLNLAVAASRRRQGIGSRFIAKLVGKLNPHRRTHISLEVRETNLGGQLFFKSHGFRAESVLRNYYDESETTEDAYVMQLHVNLVRNAGCPAVVV